MSEYTQTFWQQCLHNMADSGAVLDHSALPDSPDNAIEAVDYLMMTLSSAYLLMSRADADYPEFLPWVNHVFPYGAANPDATYYWAPLCDDGVFRVFGYRNSVSWVDFMTGRDFWGFSEEPGPSFGSQQIDQFDINVDGSFELILSRERPEGYRGNWIALQPTVNYLVIRQFAFAENEIDVRMGIERLDPVPPRQLDTPQKRQRIAETLRHLRNSSSHWPSFLLRQQLQEQGYVNKFRVANYGGTGEVIGQVYHQGLYEVEEEEALVIEVAVPRTHRYWNIQLSDRLWRTLEHMHRQSTLNGYTNRADNDGITRLVITHRDPGVANWLDACGIIEGDMIMRWMYVDEVPEPKVSRIPLADLGDFLPADTRLVNSRQRLEALRQRAMKMQLRRRW